MRSLLRIYFFFKIVESDCSRLFPIVLELIWFQFINLNLFIYFRFNRRVWTATWYFWLLKGKSLKCLSYTHWIFLFWILLNRTGIGLLSIVFRLIWNQTGFRLVPDQSWVVNCNLILDFNLVRWREKTENALSYCRKFFESCWIFN